MYDAAMSKKGGRSQKEPSRELTTGGNNAAHKWTPIETAVVSLYARGMSRKQVASALVDRLGGRSTSYTRVDRVRIAIRKLKRLEKQQWFRDKLWEMAMIETDLGMVEVMKGITHEAKRGRVEAAKLVLDVTGRHTQSGDRAPANIQIHFNQLPRPERHRQVIEGVLLGEDEDEMGPEEGD